MDKKLQIFLYKALIFLAGIAFISIFFSGYTAIREAYEGHPIMAYMVGIAIVTILLAFLSNLLPKYVFITILFLLAFGLRLEWLLNINATNISDFKIMYDSALRAAKGDFSFTGEGLYFARWGYQLGYTMYQALIIYLFGDGELAIKVINSIFSTGTVFFVYLIAKTLFNELAGRIAGILYAIFIPSIVLSSVLTNQHLATFLFYLAFYLVIRYYESNKYMWGLIGLLIALGDIIRPLGSVILIALGIYVAITFIIGGSNGTKRLFGFGKFAGILAVFYLVHTIANLLLLSAGSEYPLGNREPLWKFVTGLNHETIGVFSDKDKEYLAQFEVGIERDEASRELIKERIADKADLLELFKKKFVYMWTEKDSSLIWGLRGTGYLEFLKTLTMYERVIYLSMIFFILISVTKVVFERSLNKHLSLFLLLIAGYISVHFLIELQTRYRYFIIPSFIILQSYGVYTIISLFGRLFQQRAKGMKHQ